jgi:hypothetical protein
MEKAIIRPSLFFTAYRPGHGPHDFGTTDGKNA